MAYQVIIFDADDTLFDFNKAESYALKKVFDHYELEYDEEYHLGNYKEINAKIWDEFERELITAEALKQERFKRFFEGLGMSIAPDEVSVKYLGFLSEAAFLLEGAQEIVSKLHDKYKLALITNGLSTVQNYRLKRSPVAKYFDTVIISEEVGVAKPNPDIFKIAFERMRHDDKSTVLMIGDNLKSDIKGGINFGIDTCWYNPKGIKNNGDIKPTYEISRLSDLFKII